MRKLAAIMFTDIEGFTSLMQEDESRAVGLLDRHTQIYHRQVKLHEGETIKFMGDGTLTIFPSAIQAVHCAIAMQQAFLKNPQIPVRIGIHLGDVIVKNNDVYGDAVNLASRIQTAGVAGSVVVSEKIFTELANHPEIKAAALGAVMLKNVHQKVKLFALVASGLLVPPAFGLPGSDAKPETSVPKKKPVAFRRKKQKVLFFSSTVFFGLLLSVFLFRKLAIVDNASLPETIAVVPFISKDSAALDKYFAEGLTEEIISLLSANQVFRIKKVTGDNSSILNISNVYEVLRKSGDSSILDGSVWHDSENLVVFVYLRNPETGVVKWSKRISMPYHNPIQMQYGMAQQIFSGLLSRRARVGSAVVDERPIPDSLAAVYYQLGSQLLKNRTDSSMQAAIEYFSKAAGRDPSFAKAFSGIGDGYTLLFDNGFKPYNSGIDSARKALDRAFALDSASAEVRSSLALFYGSVEGHRKDAIRELRIALQLNQNYTSAHQWYALELAADGKFDSALYHIEKALEQEPYAKRLLANKYMFLRFARRYRDMINAQNALLPFFLHENMFLLQRVESFYRLQQADSALYYARLMQNSPYDYAFWEAVVKNDKAKLQRHLEQQRLRLSEKNETLKNETLATYYVYLGQYENAVLALEAAYNNREFSWLRFLNVRPLWDPLRNHPRFLSLLAKLGFTGSSQNL